MITDGNPQKTFLEYSFRWEIENLFGALKTRGFRFEDTHLNDLERKSIFRYGFDYIRSILLDVQQDIRNFYY